MNDILSEKEYQHFIMKKLEENGYILRSADKYDRVFAMDRELFMEFLEDTQGDTLAELRKIYKDKTEETLVNFLNQEVQKKGGSLILSLKHGLTLSGFHLDLMYTKPATSYNPELLKKYEENRFSVMEEVWADDKERIDLVVFLNGIAIMSFELKCNLAGQSYENAIYQYRHDRDPKNRLFLFKAGCLVNFAMDLYEVYMATKLSGESTYFLPFNKGKGVGINRGAGNDLNPETGLGVDYMWEDILQKDTVLELISKFIYVEVKKKTDEVTGKEKVKETLIFPRYHQLDCVRKLLADVREHGSSLNYLIEHSAGSGKTNSITWLAHRLASLHDKEDQQIFDNIVIVTDRVVVDRQLQKAVLALEHKDGLIRVMDEDCSSADLARALSGNTKIIGTTIQKFPYIVDSVKNLKNKRFAVIIDEAHSSTTGKEMAAVTQTLGSGGQDADDDSDSVIEQEIGRHGKQGNVSFFAFTATPKPTTLAMFGTINEHGQHVPFHVYSMKQAIEEKFILDVLASYTTYKTFYELEKAIEADPKYKTSEAKRKIHRYAMLHDTNITQRIQIIIEHFRTSVMEELGGEAKAMVITGSREEAVKYKMAFETYIRKMGYKDIKALVAFSGKVKVKGTEYSEAGINGFSEKKTADKFDTKEYQVLLVANKYQTGFDQPKLCAMYVLKKLRGVNAVQTLSRLNRICPPFEKKIFVLDFVNSYEDMKAAFAPFYTTTILGNSITPESIYNIVAKIDGYFILDPDDVEKFSDILYEKDGNPRHVSPAQRRTMMTLLGRAKQKVEAYDEKTQRDIRMTLRHFIRYYEYLLLVSAMDDVSLHKKYRFISYLLSMLNVSQPGGGFDLKGKIRAVNFVQKKTGEHVKEKIVAKPVVKLAGADDFGLTEAKVERLSKIIEDINSRMGKNYDNDVAVKAMLQIKDIMMKSDKLRISAQNNTEKDFEFTFNDGIDDALIEGLAQNQDFFSLLLNNPDIKKEVLGIFVDEIYRKLRGEKRGYEMPQAGAAMRKAAEEEETYGKE